MGENVPGLLSSDNGDFFGGVLSDLAALGYSVGWCVYGAVDVGAWHRRDRIFIVAYRQECGLQRCGDTRNSDGNIRDGIWSEPTRSGTTGIGTPLSDTPQRQDDGRISGIVGKAAAGGQDVPDATIKGLEGAESERGTRAGGLSSERGALPDAATRLGQSGSTQRDVGRLQNEDVRGVGNKDNGTTESGLGELADGLPPWMAGYWDAEPDGIPRVAIGVKDRVNKWKALGNACVPAQIYPVYKAIVEAESVLHQAVSNQDED